MSKLVVGVLALVGCGRIGFEALDAPGMAGDAHDDTGSDGSGGSPATSCVGLAATCGPMGNGPCCDSRIVTGGTFYRSYDVATDGMFPDMMNPATVSDFRLDKYEVTVGRFREFVAAGMGTSQSPPVVGAGAHPNIAGSGWDASWTANLKGDQAALVAALTCDATYETWTDAPGLNESRPMNCITWYEAMAFCAWDGGYPPTEAEWNYAATGGAEQRAYPWSSPPGSIAIDCAVTNYGGANWPSTECVGVGANKVGSVSPNGDGVWGQSDLGGNVWEWVLDWSASPYPNPCDDCANLTPAPTHVFRGGSFNNGAGNVRAGNRHEDITAARFNFVGVRCARTP